MIDRYTRWLEVCPLPDITADSDTWAFLFSWISRFGVPQRLTSDQGRQFTSNLFSGAARLRGISLSRTTAYQPQSNGMIEAEYRPLKASLMCHAETHWIDALPWILGMRTAVKEDIGLSSSHLVYGEPLRVPGEFLQQTPEVPTTKALQTLQSFLRILRPQPAPRHGSRQLSSTRTLTRFPSS